MTINLLRKSRFNPKLSVYAQLEGAFDFNKTTLAPVGTKVIVHENLESRPTWSPHGVDGWYLGLAMHHYRCYQIWIRDTRNECIADTLAWFPTLVKIPKTSSADAALIAEQQLTAALRNPSPSTPLAPMFDEHRSALDQLAAMFYKKTAKTDAQPPRLSKAQTAEPSKLPRVSVSTPSEPGSNSEPGSKLEPESNR